VLSNIGTKLNIGKRMQPLDNVIGPVTPEKRKVTTVPSSLFIGNPSPHPSHACTLTEFDYAADTGQRVPGTMIQPSGRSIVNEGTVVVYFHQTTEPQSAGRKEPAGIEGNPEMAYGVELACQGFVAVGTDYPGFGEYSPDTYGLGFKSVTAQMIWNHLVLLNLLEELGVRSTAKVICIGHSLGGTNAMIFARYSESVRLLVCSGSATTFSSFANLHGGTLSRWSRSDKYMPLIRAEYNDDPTQMPFDIPEILFSFAPHPLVLSSTENDEIFPVLGAEDCAREVEKEYTRLNVVEKFRFILNPGPHQFDAEARKESYEFVSAMVAAGALK